MKKVAKKNIWSKVGVWSFVAGFVIAVLFALFAGVLQGYSLVILAVLGLIVGLLNIVDEEVSLFLLASLVFLVAAGSMTTVLQVFPGLLGDWLQRFFVAVVVFVSPAAFIVSLTALYHIAKD